MKCGFLKIGFFRLLTVQWKAAQQRENDVFSAKFGLTSSKFVLDYSYSFGLMDRSGSVNIMTDIAKASTSNPMNFAETEIFTRAKLMANKNRFIVDGVMTIVCQVRLHLTIYISTSI